MDLISIAFKGGYLMIILFVISVIAVALFFERWLITKKALKFEQKTFLEILKLIDQQQSTEAAKVCKLSNFSICKILEQGLHQAELDIILAQETIEQSANQFIRGLEKNINTISTFAAVAPLIGFLGTVTGMIRVFFQIQQSETGVDIQVLAGGIWEALITTVGGLIVGIVCIILHNFLINKIEAVAFLVEEKISQVSLHLRRTQK
ncbi:MAG: MotA/TolQ/ExbB proton channel family protein [Candidatus Cloacimonetes bacterium]|nr:MotA/TolQ/ExbB proton channel family protein [Candidatus Cloacimonadota bacterium]